MTNIIPFNSDLRKPLRSDEFTVENVFNRAHETSKKYFRVGDTFTTEDGLKVHIMAERDTDKGRQFLYSSHGMRVWESDDKFVRAG